MTDAPVTHTVESALIALADVRRFRPTDVGFGHGCAARLRNGIAISGEDARRAYRLLESYRDDLAELGIDYATMPRPTQIPSATERAGTIRTTAPAATPIGRSSVWLADGHLWLRSPYAARQIVREQVLAAKWDKARRAYKLPATPQAALSIATALGNHGIDADDASTQLVQQGHAGRRAQVKRVATDLPPVPGSKTDAWLHQRQAFWFAREMNGAILDMEMGTGKSKVVVDLIHDSGAENVMIMCPERVVGVWPKQFGLHCGGEKHIIDPRKQNGAGQWNLLPIAARVELYEHALHECRCGLPHVLMTNYAATAHEPFASWALRQHFDYVAYDECHRLRSHKGVWSRWAEKMRDNTDRALGGTGTFQTQSPLDVFGQVRAVEPGLFGKTFTGFRARYAVMGGYEGKEVKDFKNEDELAQRLAQVSYRAGEEVLDLPEMLPDIDVVGNLSPRALRAYREFEADMYTVVRRMHEDGTLGDSEELTADNVLVRILRCQQITGGAVPLDDGTIEEIDDTKFKLLVDELEDIPSSSPVIVFARFHHDLDKIAQAAEKVGRTFAELSGRRSDALAADATLAPGVELAGVQIQSGGTGVDFTAAAYGIYYSVGHSLGDYLQSRKRLWRPGQIKPVQFRHLVMAGTIDEAVYEALAERKSIVDRITSLVVGLQAAS